MILLPVCSFLVILVEMEALGTVSSKTFDNPLPSPIKWANEPVPVAVTLSKVYLFNAPDKCKFSVKEPEPMNI